MSSYVPFRVQAHMVQPAVSYSGLRLDAVLAYAVVYEQTQGRMLPQTNDYVRTELPLAVLWESDKGVPLWASTDLMPDGAAAASQSYMHRRALEPSMSRRNLRTTQGRHREKRSPLPTVGANVFVADGLGDPEEVARLLQFVPAVGKKRGAGYGHVAEWRVYEIDKLTLVDQQHKTRRPIPHAALFNGTLDLSFSIAHLGFSPPYWHHATASLVLPTGTDLSHVKPSMELSYSAINP